MPNNDLKTINILLIEDADKSPQENKNTEQAFRERVEVLIREVKNAGLVHEKNYISALKG